MPTVVRKDLDNTHYEISISVSRDELKPKLDAELKKFRQKAPIKGFRAGQAPMPFVKKLYGKSIFSDTLNDLINDELVDHLKTVGLNVLGQPIPTLEQKSFTYNIDKLEDEYSVNFEVGHAPDFDIKGLDGSEVFDFYVISDLDELAEKELETVRKNAPQSVAVTGPVQAGDVLKIKSFELESETGGLKEYGLETTFSVSIDSVSDETLKAELLAKSQGDSLRFNARGLDNFAEEARYRKYMLNLEDGDDRVVGDWFEGVIEEVFRAGEAELNEDFYKKHFGEEVTDKDAALAFLKREANSFFEQRSNGILMRDIQERLMGLNKIDLPDAFLKRWLAASNKDLSASVIEAEYKPFADNLRWTLLKDKLIKENNIVVTEDDIRQVFAAQVYSYFRMQLPYEMIESTVNRLMQNQKQVEEVSEDLMAEKVFTALRSKVALADKPIHSDAFSEMLNNLSKRAAVEQQEDIHIQDALEV